MPGTIQVDFLRRKAITSLREREEVPTRNEHRVRIKDAIYNGLE